MARGRSGGGGSRSSGGHSSSSRSSGGHRSSSYSSSSRSRSASSYSSHNRSHSSTGRNNFGGPYSNSSRPIHHSGGYAPRRHYTPRPPIHHHGGSYHPPRRSGGCVPTVVAMCIVILLLFSFFGHLVSGSINSSIPSSTVNREKVSTGVAFSNDCIVDEAGWFDNPAYLSRKLQDFYSATGIQPYIYIKAYDPSLTTDAQKEAYAVSWYEENIDNEGTFLYVYFEEADDYGNGYMCYVNGKEITTVMDAEAIDIFWAYIDSVWESNLDDEEMFVHVFSKTAKRIMDKTTTGADIGKWVIVGVVIVIAGFLIVKIMKTKRQHEKEKNAETERILNTPLDTSSPLDDLADKYTGSTDENNT